VSAVDLTKECDGVRSPNPICPQKLLNLSQHGYCKRLFATWSPNCKESKSLGDGGKRPNLQKINAPGDARMIPNHSMKFAIDPTVLLWAIMIDQRIKRGAFETNRALCNIAKFLQVGHGIALLHSCCYRGIYLYIAPHARVT